MKPPVISLKPFLNGTSAQRLVVAQDIRQAMCNYGCFHLVDHTVGSKLEQGVWKEMSNFFNKPLKDKLNIEMKAAGLSRGYIPLGGESGSDAYEVKEAFSYGYEWPSDKQPLNTLQGPNVWPSDINFVKTMQELFNAKVKTAQALTRALSLSLELPESTLGSYCQSGDTISLMRLFRYLPKEAGRNSKDLIGSSPHTDWGFLTLTMQDEPGLELDLKTWFKVEHLPGALFVNGGDYLSLLTGGEYLSPLHRVSMPKNQRLSSVFFYYPSYDAQIPVMKPGMRHSLYEDQSVNKQQQRACNTFGQFIEAKWNQVYRKVA